MQAGLNVFRLKVGQLLQNLLGVQSVCLNRAKVILKWASQLKDRRGIASFCIVWATLLTLLKENDLEPRGVVGIHDNF